jgi:hypothetical protein
MSNIYLIIPCNNKWTPLSSILGTNGVCVSDKYIRVTSSVSSLLLTLEEVDELISSVELEGVILVGSESS